MLRLIIKSQKHGESYRDFNNQAEINEFLDEKGDHFGRLAFVETIPALVDDQGNIVEEEYTINREATVEYQVIDVTDEVNEENLFKRRLNNQQFGASLLADIAEMNSKKQYTLVQFEQLMSDQALATIERLLWSGSLVLAKGLISSYSGSWYTEQEKELIVNKINNYLGV